MYAIMMYAAGVDIVRMIPLNKISETFNLSGRRVVHVSDHSVHLSLYL